MIKKKESLYLKYISLISIILLTVSTTNGNSLTGSQFTNGDAIVWEIGNGKIVTGFMKATFNSTDNRSIQVDLNKYNLLGDQSSTPVYNISLPRYWKTPENVTDLGNSGNLNGTVDILGEARNCVILDNYYDGVTTSYYYDRETGIMVYSIDTNDNFERLVSWEDIDVKGLADSYNTKEISSSNFGVSFSFLGCLLFVIYKTFKFNKINRKKDIKRI